jgi:hypothetical protein
VVCVIVVDSTIFVDEGSNSFDVICRVRIHDSGDESQGQR